LRCIRRLLYAEYDAQQKPSPAPETIARLRDLFASDIEKLDASLDTSLSRRWSYADNPAGHETSSEKTEAWALAKPIPSS
jgi:hypothetical protein